MNVHISYRTGKTPQTEREFVYQIEKLERRLHVYKPDLVHLHAVLGHENGHSMNVSLNLRLPTGQLAAQESGDNLVGAVKAAFVELLSQVTRHKDLLRGERSWKSRRRGQFGESGPASVVLEQEIGSLDRRSPSGSPKIQAAGNGVNDWISANLKRLERFAERELRYRVATGQMRENQVAPEEVIDEVMVRALSQQEEEGAGSPSPDFGAKTGRSMISPEGWFYRLALQAIGPLIQASADTAGVSLDASAAQRNVTGSDENALQYHQPDDSLSEESTIPDQDSKTPEQIAFDDEFMSQLDLVLDGLKPEDREAFVLFALEGFTVEEITRIGGRSGEEVRKSIARARHRAQSKFPGRKDLKERLLRPSRAA